MDSWSDFWRVFWRTALGAFLVCVAFLVVTNPYRNIPFLDGVRWPLMDVNQRYLYPSIARDPRYDSAVFGTSSSRLLKPALLDQKLGGTFAQMSMNAAVAYEQYRLSTLYIDWRQKRDLPIKTVIFGLDTVWCTVGSTYPKKTVRPFPPWMYDHNPWNDVLHLFESKAIEIGGRTIGYWLGINEPEYGVDGFSNFLPPASAYDVVKARKNIYGAAGTAPEQGYVYPIAPHPDAQNWTYATHPLFDELMSKLDANTKKIVVFVPLHFHKVGGTPTISQQRHLECKERIKNKLKTMPNSMLIDFMIPSSITTVDENYWDPLHYTVETADELVHLIAEAVNGNSRDDARYDVLLNSIGQN